MSQRSYGQICIIIIAIVIIIQCIMYKEFIIPIIGHAGEHQNGISIDKPNNIIKKDDININDNNGGIIIGNHTIVVGYCCEKESENGGCNPQEFFEPIVHGIFPNKKYDKSLLYYQECKRNGFPRNHIQMNWNLSQRHSMNTINKSFTDDTLKKIWIEPDIYLCQGFFYDKSFQDRRMDIKDKVSIDNSTNNELRKEQIFLKLNRQHQVNIITHKLDDYRPWMMTYNTEVNSIVFMCFFIDVIIE